MKVLRYVLVIPFLALPIFADAQESSTPDPVDIQARIDQRAQNIKDLEKEIAGYEGQINALSSQADSLSSTISSLDLTKKKLNAQISLTEDKIAAANTAVQSLGYQISDTQKEAEADKRSVARAFVLLNEEADRSLPEIFLSSDSISGAWDAANQLAAMADSLNNGISRLQKTAASLTSAQDSKIKTQKDLSDLRSQLNGQKSAVSAASNEKNSLLEQTKQSQASYQIILADKKAQKDAFEAEMQTYESQLHLNVSLAQIPHTGSGVLFWPLDAITITQYFGNTPFATANPQIYNGKGHTGVDFRATIGTTVKAALSGIVAGAGDTDIVPGCYSYGKWIMIRHANGLSTLYGHLSYEAVKTGDTVSTGEVIGYSGNTGYTTGPHLHFGVYATAGVKITTFDSSKNCKGAIIPLADWSAYLNPLSYL